MRTLFRPRTVPIAIAALLSGCATTNLPLVFGRAHNVGITIAGSLPEQGGELTLGYRDKDIAVVPIEKQAHAPGAAGVHDDALSVLGQFEVDAKAAQPQVSLGKFFATGLAAKTLADGFKCQLGKDAPPAECRAAAAPAAPKPATGQ